MVLDCVETLVLFQLVDVVLETVIGRLDKLQLVLVLASETVVDLRYLTEHIAILFDLVHKTPESSILFDLFDHLVLDKLDLFVLLLKFDSESFCLTLSLSSQVLLTL